MGDQPRLLEGDELERELLGSLRDVASPRGAKGETWDRLAIQIAAVATIGTTSAAVHAVVHSGAGAGAGAAVQATKVFTLKVVASVALAGSMAAGGGWWLHRQVSPLAAVPIAEPVPSPAPPRAPERFEQTRETPAPEPAPADPVERPSTGSPGRSRSDLLALESRKLTESRAALRGGDPRAALATLERLRTRSPKGVLAQERDVLAIQIASALGDAVTAKRKAAEFIRAYPESPHAAQLRRLAADP